MWFYSSTTAVSAQSTCIREVNSASGSTTSSFVTHGGAPSFNGYTSRGTSSSSSAETSESNNASTSFSGRTVEAATVTITEEPSYSYNLISSITVEESRITGYTGCTTWRRTVYSANTGGNSSSSSQSTETTLVTRDSYASGTSTTTFSDTYGTTTTVTTNASQVTTTTGSASTLFLTTSQTAATTLTTSRTTSSVGANTIYTYAPTAVLTGPEILIGVTEAPASVQAWDVTVTAETAGYASALGSTFTRRFATLATSGYVVPISSTGTVTRTIEVGSTAALTFSTTYTTTSVEVYRPFSSVFPATGTTTRTIALLTTGTLTVEGYSNSNGTDTIHTQPAAATRTNVTAVGLSYVDVTITYHVNPTSTSTAVIALTYTCMSTFRSFRFPWELCTSASSSTSGGATGSFTTTRSGTFTTTQGAVFGTTVAGTAVTTLDNSSFIGEEQHASTSSTFFSGYTTTSTSAVDGSSRIYGTSTFSTQYSEIGSTSTIRRTEGTTGYELLTLQNTSGSTQTSAQSFERYLTRSTTFTENFETIDTTREEFAGNTQDETTFGQSTNESGLDSSTGNFTYTGSFDLGTVVFEDRETGVTQTESYFTAFYSTSGITTYDGAGGGSVFSTLQEFFTSSGSTSVFDNTRTFASNGVYFIGETFTTASSTTSYSSSSSGTFSDSFEVAAIDTTTLSVVSATTTVGISPVFISSSSGTFSSSTQTTHYETVSATFTTVVTYTFPTTAEVFTTTNGTQATTTSGSFTITRSTGGNSGYTSSERQALSYTYRLLHGQATLHASVDWSAHAMHPLPGWRDPMSVTTSDAVYLAMSVSPSSTIYYPHVAVQDFGYSGGGSAAGNRTPVFYTETSSYSRSAVGSASFYTAQWQTSDSCLHLTSWVTFMSDGSQTTGSTYTGAVSFIGATEGTHFEHNESSSVSFPASRRYQVGGRPARSEFGALVLFPPGVLNSTRQTNGTSTSSATTWLQTPSTISSTDIGHAFPTSQESVWHVVQLETYALIEGHHPFGYPTPIHEGSSVRPMITLTKYPNL